MASSIFFSEYFLYKPGRPQISPRTTYAQAIHEIIPTSSPIEGAANKWRQNYMAQFDKGMVERKLNNLKQSTCWYDQWK
jgi:hypothetical protein